MVAIEPSKTQRIYLLLKEQILKGAIPAGQRLPSEPALAVSHKLSRVTIRRALEGLERDGLIRRQPGAGTFVLDGSARKGVVGDLSNMLAHLVAMGRATQAHLLDFGYSIPTPAVAEALKLDPGERVQHSVRLRLIDETPFSHLTAYVPERIGSTYSEDELATTPLLTLLERSGVVADKASQVVTATLAGPEIAGLLRVEIGSPLISMTRVVFDDRGRGVEYLAALYRPDLHTFQMEMTRTGIGAERRWSPVSSIARNTQEFSTGKRRLPAPRHRV